MAFAFAVSMGADAFAGSPPPVAPQVPLAGPAWANPQNYEACGQGCMYEKANETLSLQALYLLNKQDKIAEAVDAANHGDQYSETAARQELTPIYCEETEELNTCYQRYLIMTVPVLEKIKVAIATNSSSAYALHSGTEVVPSPVYIKSDQIPLKLPQTPEVPRVQDIYARMQSLPAKENYSQWISEAKPYKPEPGDYPLFISVKRDPARPAAGSFTVIQHNPDGSIAFDKKAYEAAMAVYNEKLSQGSTRGAISAAAYTTLAQRKKVGLVDGRYHLDKKGAPTDHSLSYSAYIDAENQMVSATNNVLGRPDFNKPVSAPPTPANSPAAIASTSAQKSAHGVSRVDRLLAAQNPRPTTSTQPTTAASTPQSGSDYSADAKAKYDPADPNAFHYKTLSDQNGEALRAPVSKVPENTANSLTVNYDPKDLEGQTDPKNSANDTGIEAAIQSINQ